MRGCRSHTASSSSNSEGWPSGRRSMVANWSHYTNVLIFLESKRSDRYIMLTKPMADLFDSTYDSGSASRGGHPACPPFLINVTGISP